MDDPWSPAGISDAVAEAGWRYLLGELCTSVSVGSFAQAVTVAQIAAAACGDKADGHLRVDLRPERVELSLASRDRGAATGEDVSLAQAVTAALDGDGLRTAGATTAAGRRPVESLEIGIDTRDVGAIRPFWQAVLGLVDDPAGGSALVDPVGQLPAIWFQDMDADRPQRNRVHLDVTVAHDEAQPRVEAALAAGGKLLTDAFARSFWVLADAEGNEVCVCTWQDRGGA